MTLIRVCPVHIGGLLSLLSMGFVTAESANDGCRIPADPDIQGLGVRLGLYFQLISTLLMALVRPSEAAVTYMPTALFLTSFLIAVLYSAIRNEFPPSAVISCTWYPVLVMATLIPLDFSEFSQRQKMARAFLSQLCMYLSLCLNLWFWFKGLDIQSNDQCMTPRVFFFNNLSAYGNIRTLFKALNAGFVGVLVLSFLFGFFCYRPPLRVADGEHHEQGRNEAQGSRAERPFSELYSPTQRHAPISFVGPSEQQELQASTAESHEVAGSSAPPKRATTMPAILRATTAPAVLTPTPLPAILRRATTGNAQVDNKIKIVWSFVPGGLIWLVFYIVASELQIKWNHLDSVNSISTTGQIFPLVLGCLSLLRTLFVLKDLRWESLTGLRPGTFSDALHAWSD